MLTSRGGGGGGCLQCDIMEEYDRFGSEFWPLVSKTCIKMFTASGRPFSVPTPGSRRAAWHDGNTADFAQAELGLASSACS